MLISEWYKRMTSTEIKELVRLGSVKCQGKYPCLLVSRYQFKVFENRKDLGNIMHQSCLC